MCLCFRKGLFFRLLATVATELQKLKVDFEELFRKWSDQNLGVIGKPTLPNFFFNNY